MVHDKLKNVYALLSTKGNAQVYGNARVSSKYLRLCDKTGSLVVEDEMPVIERSTTYEDLKKAFQTSQVLHMYRKTAECWSPWNGYNLDEVWVEIINIGEIDYDEYDENGKSYAMLEMKCVGNNKKMTAFVGEDGLMCSWGSFIPIAEYVEVLPKIVNTSEYPHTCLRCGAPAYVGAVRVECSKCGEY